MRKQWLVASTILASGCFSPNLTGVNEGSATAGDSTSGTTATENATSGSSGGSSATTGVAVSSGSSTGDGLSTGDGSDTTSGKSSTTGEPAETDFVVSVENVSGLGPVPTAVSPGVWALRSGLAAGPWSVGESATPGLERLAEDGDPSTARTEWERLAKTEAEVFEVPLGQDEAGAIEPGERYEFTVSAQPGDRLSLSSMIFATNDVVWWTGPGGLPLFDDEGSPLSQDATSLLELYDVGSEANQPPGGGIYLRLATIYQ